MIARSFMMTEAITQHVELHRNMTKPQPDIGRFSATNSAPQIPKHAAHHLRTGKKRITNRCQMIRRRLTTHHH